MCVLIGTCVGTALRQHHCQLASTCNAAKEKANKSFETKQKQKSVGQCGKCGVGGSWPEIVMGIDLGNRRGIKLGCKHVDNVLIQFNMRSQPNHTPTGRFLYPPRNPRTQPTQSRTNSYNWLLLRVQPFSLRFPPPPRKKPKPNSTPYPI